MARKRQESSATRRDVRQTVRTGLRIAGWSLSLVLVAFGVVWGALQGEQFISSDRRFQLPPLGASATDDAIVVRGVKNASTAEILRVFDGDRGRSLIDVDLPARRAAITSIEWVREASVRRIWPNRLSVEVDERQPVAFIQNAERATGNPNEPLVFTPRLIDADGVILPVRGSVAKNLPLVIGIREQDAIERRQSRVLKVMRILDELKQHRDRISEVDVTNPSNLRICYEAPDRQVLLALGNERYNDRLEIFLRHYDGIRDRITPRSVLGVSIEGRITVIDTVETASR